MTKLSQPLLVLINRRAFAEVLVDVAFYHTVINLSSLIRLFAEMLFKLLVGCKDIVRPVCKLSEGFAHILIKLIAFLGIAKSFAVWRIADNTAVACI